MKKHYNDPDGSKFPVGSPEYTKWLNTVYREMMMAEIQERARQASQKVKHGN